MGDLAKLKIILKESLKRVPVLGIEGSTVIILLLSYLSFFPGRLVCAVYSIHFSLSDLDHR